MSGLSTQQTDRNEIQDPAQQIMTKLGGGDKIKAPNPKESSNWKKKETDQNEQELYNNL